MLVEVELGCELKWQVTGQEPDLFSCCPGLPHLCKPPAPSQRRPAPLSHREPQPMPLEAWSPNNSADPRLTRPFIRAGDHEPSGPTAAQVGSPSQLHFRETLPLQRPVPPPTLASRLLAPQQQLERSRHSRSEPALPGTEHSPPGLRALGTGGCSKQ